MRVFKSAKNSQKRKVIIHPYIPQDLTVAVDSTSTHMLSLNMSAVQHQLDYNSPLQHMDTPLATLHHDLDVFMGHCTQSIVLGDSYPDLSYLMNPEVIDLTTDHTDIIDLTTYTPAAESLSQNHVVINIVNSPTPEVIDLTTSDKVDNINLNTPEITGSTHVETDVVTDVAEKLYQWLVSMRNSDGLPLLSGLHNTAATAIAVATSDTLYEGTFQNQVPYSTKRSLSVETIPEVRQKKQRYTVTPDTQSPLVAIVQPVTCRPY